MRRGLDGFSCFFPSSSAVFKLHGGCLEHFRWRDSERETPLPIPNRAVKPLSADGTWRATSWESRSPPVLLQGRPSGRPFLSGARREAVDRAGPGPAAPSRDSPMAALAGLAGPLERLEAILAEG